MNMATPVWMVFSLSAYLTVDASPVRVRSLRGRLPLLYMPRATGSPVTVETWRHVILFCPAPFATRGPSRSLRGCHSNARVRNTILPSSIHFLSYLIFSLNFIFLHLTKYGLEYSSAGPRERIWNNDWDNEHAYFATCTKWNTGAIKTTQKIS